MDKPAFWAVIPATVRYDEDLRPNAKLLYAEITSLMGQAGYCFASNQYFQDCFGISDRAVTALIAQLKSKGYITVDIVNEGGKTERRITADRVILMDDRPEQKCGAGCTKVRGAPEQKCGAVNMNNILNINNPPKVPQGTERVRSQPRHSPERFEKLWEFYPHEKRGNRQRAVKAWDKLKADDALIDTIARALVSQLKSDEWSRGIGIPHLSSYLNAAYWEGAEDMVSSPDTGSGWADDPEVM